MNESHYSRAVRPSVETRGPSSSKEEQRAHAFLVLFPGSEGRRARWSAPGLLQTKCNLALKAAADGEGVIRIQNRE